MRVRLLAAILVGVAALGGAMASAEETGDGRIVVAETGFFQRLFGLHPRETPAPGPKIIRPPRQGRPGANTDFTPGPTTPKKIRPKKQAPPPPPQDAKDDDARHVLVIGDRLADSLAKGLDVAFADTPGVVIDDEAVSPSGLADPAVDWPKTLGERLGGAKPPSAVVVMLGSDDRVPLMVDGASAEFRSAPWEKVYVARARALVAAAVERRIPVYWVGLVPMGDDAMTTDMAYLDEIDRKVAGEGLGHYVDVWNAFADETGSFAASGPDVGGQERQLRLKDGIGFTKSGGRKLAFYVEQELRSWLSNGVAAAAAPQRTVAGGLVLSLSEPDALPGEDLTGAGPPPSPKEGTPLYRLVVLGKPLRPRTGRVDDLSD